MEQLQLDMGVEISVVRPNEKQRAALTQARTTYGFESLLDLKFKRDPSSKGIVLCI
jgi:hypothetical protein